MAFGEVSADGTSLTLCDGSQHPMVGFGTYKIGFVPASSNTAGALFCHVFICASTTSSLYISTDRYSESPSVIGLSIYITFYRSYAYNYTHIDIHFSFFIPIVSNTRSISTHTSVLSKFCGCKRQCMYTYKHIHKRL